jgi:hypothetical protein
MLFIDFNAPSLAHDALAAACRIPSLDAGVTADTTAKRAATVEAMVDFMGATFRIR